MIADGSGCHDMKYLIQRAYAAGKGHQYIRLLQDDILAVAQVVCGDYLIGVCTYFAVFFQFGRYYTDDMSPVFFDCFGHAFHESEVGTTIDKCLAVFPHPFANLMGGIEVYRVDAAGCGTENSYLLHKGY